MEVESPTAGDDERRCGVHRKENVVKSWSSPSSVLLFGVLVLMVPLTPISASEVQTIGVFPFKDDSGFRGKWDLAMEVPALLGRLLTEDLSCQVVFPDSVQQVINAGGTRLRGAQWCLLSLPIRASRSSVDLDDPVGLARIGKEIGADVVIAGTIADFNATRFQAGDPMIGGYKSYSAEVALREVHVIRVGGAEEIGLLDAHEKLVDRDLGLDLLGRPRERDREFLQLDQLSFGSEEFRRTVLGETAFKALETLKARIKGILAAPVTADITGGPIEILAVQDDTVFLAAGSEDGMKVGIRLTVYAGTGREHTEDERVGSIEVTAVEGPHLSKGRVLEGDGRISPDHVVWMP
jgi:hypothetical protein